MKDNTDKRDVCEECGYFGKRRYVSAQQKTAGGPIKWLCSKCGFAALGLLWSPKTEMPKKSSVLSKIRSRANKGATKVEEKKSKKSSALSRLKRRASK